MSEQTSGQVVAIEIPGRKRFFNCPTWGEFKRCLENQGIEDNDLIGKIDWNAFFLPKIELYAGALTEIYDGDDVESWPVSDTDES